MVQQEKTAAGPGAAETGRPAGEQPAAQAAPEAGAESGRAVQDTEAADAPVAQDAADAGQDVPADTAAQLAAARQKADELQVQLDQARDRLLRTAAEFDNFRKRSQREKDAAFGDGLAHAVAALLPVLDTLEMAAAAQTADDNYKKGVQMTLQKAGEVFKKLDVAEIEALGKEFDPGVMNAVMQQPAPEGTGAGVVLQVLQKGYTHAGKVIRHAAVAVSQ